MWRSFWGLVPLFLLGLAVWWVGSSVLSFLTSYGCLIVLVLVGLLSCYASRDITSIFTPATGLFGGWVFVKVAGLLTGTSYANVFPLLLSFQSASPIVIAGRVVSVVITLLVAGWFAFSGDDNKLEASDVDGLHLVNNPALGTARWATWQSMKGQVASGWPKERGRGVIIGKLQGQVIRFLANPPVSPHVLVVGGTGAGKSVGFVMPNIYAAAMAGDSLVVADPKGELLQATGGWLQQQGYDVRVFDLLSNRGQGWNPLETVQSEQEIDLLADTLIRNAVKDIGRETAYFFALEKSALMAVMSFVQGLPPGQNHFLNVMSLLIQPSDVLGQLIKNRGPKAAVESWGQVESAKTSPLVGLSARLNIIRQTGSLLAPEPGAGIDFSMLRARKTALFCILPVGDVSLKPILAAFYTFLFRRLCYGQQNINSETRTVRLLLDEFANLGHIGNFNEVISIARGYGVNASIVLQTLSQLRDLYGEAEARNISGNCGLQILLGTQDFETAQIFSRALGYAAVRMRQDRVNLTLGKRYLERGADEVTVRRALMEPAEILRLPAQKGIAVIDGKPPILFRKINFSDEQLGKEVLSHGPGIVPLRSDPPESVNLFDLLTMTDGDSCNSDIDGLF